MTWHAKALQTSYVTAPARARKGATNPTPPFLTDGLVVLP